jgi:hypothetical protein
MREPTVFWSKVAMCLAEVGIFDAILAVGFNPSTGDASIMFKRGADETMARKAVELVCPGATISFDATPRASG